MSSTVPTVTERAASSKGSSSTAIYQLVASVLRKKSTHIGKLVDVGCGTGELLKYVTSFVDHYIGADVVRYESFPVHADFLQIDLDAGRVSVEDGMADVVVAVETIEHLENPRAFFRELCRLVKPGGHIVVTTPNQLSLLSLLTLMTKGHFNAFQEAPGLYPAHITALLETDLRRMAHECGLHDIEIGYTNCGRLPFSSLHWPTQWRFRGRLFSDNLLLCGRMPQSIK